MSAVILPEEIGRPAMVEKVAAGVKVAMERAGITDPKDVHYVQTKTPLLTLPTIGEAKARGNDVFTEDTLHSMDVSNGTAALGIAVALGEIDDADRRADHEGHCRCSRRWRRARPASSSTRARSSWSATSAGSAAATASATR